MKRKNILKLISLSVFCLVILSQCKSRGKDGFAITVSYKNLEKMTASLLHSDAGKPQMVKSTVTANIMLQEIPYGGDMNPVIIDSSTLTGNQGTVILEGKAREESIFQLVINDRPLLLLVNDADEIEVSIDLSKQEDFYTIKNSPASQKLKDFIYAYSDKSFQINKAFATIDSLKQFGGNDSIIILATENKNKAVTEINNFQQDFINKSENPALSVFALGLASRSFPKDKFEKSLNDVVARFPEHETLKKLKSIYEQQQANAGKQQQQIEPAKFSWIGKPAPELSLPTPAGDTVSIQSFKGKYVLVDFWASWCGPCRQENPNVVKAYNQFKNKNFTILGVSLDQKKPNWEQAIKDDKLTWTHISDLKFWDSKAVEIYKFDGIPYNVLVDPNGIIIAENLRGFDLINKLQQVLK